MDCLLSNGVRQIIQTKITHQNDHVQCQTLPKKCHGSITRNLSPCKHHPTVGENE